MAAPAISLIIPCYNIPEHQIARALESVYNQDFSDYEMAATRRIGRSTPA